MDPEVAEVGFGHAFDGEPERVEVVRRFGVGLSFIACVDPFGAAFAEAGRILPGDLLVADGDGLRGEHTLRARLATLSVGAEAGGFKMGEMPASSRVPPGELPPPKVMSSSRSRRAWITHQTIDDWVKKGLLDERIERRRPLGHGRGSAAPWPDSHSLIRLARANDRSPSRELARALAFYIAHESKATDYFRGRVRNEPDA